MAQSRTSGVALRGRRPHATGTHRRHRGPLLPRTRNALQSEEIRFASGELLDVYLPVR